MVITDYTGIYVITLEKWDIISWHGMRNTLFKKNKRFKVLFEGKIG